MSSCAACRYYKTKPLCDLLSRNYAWKELRSSRCVLFLRSWGLRYVFAITLTSSCTDWLKEQVDFQVPGWEQRILAGTQGTGWDRSSLQHGFASSSICGHLDFFLFLSGVKEVHHFFGNIPRSVYTLFQTALGGISWYEVTDALANVDMLLSAVNLSFLCPEWCGIDLSRTAPALTTRAV